MTDWSKWIGRTEEVTAPVSAAALAGLGAVLDHAETPWPASQAPPLFHWLHFLPHARQSDIDRDGHPKRGGFLPPVDLPRRMWAGSRLEFLAPVAIDAALDRRSEIVRIDVKEGASGQLVFVTVQHEIAADGVLAVREEQDIVYRGNTISTPAGRAAEQLPSPELTRTVVADPVLLFRYSALTFNSHRIHYDRDYARAEEGYPALVVQGPLLATLLMDLALRHARDRRPARFAFSARRPLFDGAVFDLCMTDDDATATLWTRDADGVATMTATLDWTQL